MASPATSLLLRQFTEGHYTTLLTHWWQISGVKTPGQLNAIIPSITQNLFDSSKSFIDAIANKDTEFIGQTATRSLQSKLVPLVNEIKNTEIRQVAHQSQQTANSKNSSGYRFTISPYVIFGIDMKERLLQEQPWANKWALFASNRFLHITPGEGFSLSKLRERQVYGFHCHLTSEQKGYEIAGQAHPPKEWVLTFETNSEDYEFYVADLNYFVRFGLS